jgi:hypothetical protein
MAARAAAAVVVVARVRTYACTSTHMRTQRLADSRLSAACWHCPLADMTLRHQVAKINESVDIPLLSEEQEAVIIDKCLATISTQLLNILPPAWLGKLVRNSCIAICKATEDRFFRASFRRYTRRVDSHQDGQPLEATYSTYKKTQQHHFYLISGVVSCLN